MHDLKTLIDQRINTIDEVDFTPEVSVFDLVESQIVHEYTTRANNPDDPTEFSEQELKLLVEAAHEALDTTTCEELSVHIQERLQAVRDHTATMAEHLARPRTRG